MLETIVKSAILYVLNFLASAEGEMLLKDIASELENELTGQPASPADAQQGVEVATSTSPADPAAPDGLVSPRANRSNDRVPGSGNFANSAS